MIDLSVEKPLPLAAAAATIPPGRSGKKTHISTLLRWILSGAKAPDGSVVRLEGLRLGGRWLTSREALQRFSEQLTPQVGEAPAAKTATSNQRRRAAERADEQVQSLGV